MSALPPRLVTGVLALLALAATLVLRLIPTVFQPSLDWGDEVYQATEPAHRLVFGTGLVTWEFVVGIRSWLLPGAIAGIMKMGALGGAGPAFYLPAVAACCACLSLVPVLGTFGWCRPRFGVWPALAGAAVVALAPEMVYFGARTLAEVVAGHLLIAAMFVAMDAPPDAAVARSRKVAAGLLLGLAAALRPQVMPAVIVLLAWPGTRSPWRLPGNRGRWYLAGGAVLMLTASSALDWVTLGAPAASIWRYAMVNAQGAGDSFGIQPWYYFGLAEAAIWGPALPIPIVLCLVGARRWPLPLAAALAIIAAHMLIGHKEHRFIYPALALCAVQAGTGMADLTARLASRLAPFRSGSSATRFAAVAGCLAWAVVSVSVWFGPGLTTLRHRAQDTLEAADYAAYLPGVCGIGMGPGKDAWVPYGGYTHLHQEVPLFWPVDQAAFGREAPGFNLLLSEAHEPGYKVLRCFGAVCAARRAGECAPAPADKMPHQPNVLKS